MDKTLSKSIIYGVDEIIRRATESENELIVNYIKKLFEKHVCPCYENDDLKEEGIAMFWNEISQFFDYKFTKEERLVLSQDSVIGPFHFVQKLVKAYNEKFAPLPINHPINELHVLSLEMADKVIRKERYT